ncbi:MAG: hypothetical protein KF696_01915 [Planctomycetes bacterium]|nr:hypothetical protein [Planctomycetota bacterium]MCW8134757.1 hypothetical protein [Planctomycetota bacterium]
MYEVNRARANPQGYDTEKGLGGVCNGITPAHPLALNERLVTSSRFHSAEMAQHGYFAHTSPITGHQPNKMARNAGYPLKSSYPDAANYIESLAGIFGSSSSISYEATAAVRALILDAGVNPPGHRYHLLSWGGSQAQIDTARLNRECGAGYATGIGANGYAAGAYWAFHTGVRDTSVTFIAGVVYNDANDNGRFDNGEALPGVTVKLINWNTQQQVGTFTTGAGGAYTHQAGNGTWVLEVSGGSFSGTRWAKITVSGQNVQVDFRSNSNNADINFGSWGQLPGSASVDGSTMPAPPPTSGGGGGGTGGGGSGGTGGGGGSGPVEYGGSNSCVAGHGTHWALLAMALLAMAAVSLRRTRA